MAIARDNGMCVICFFRYGKKTKHTQVHHIYSRDQASGGWREHYTNMMCVCNDCHPLPIQLPGASKALGWVEDIADQMNRTPINPLFAHTYTGRVTHGIDT